jgi:hypothetical protein
VISLGGSCKTYTGWLWSWCGDLISGMMGLNAHGALRSTDNIIDIQSTPTIPG